MIVYHVTTKINWLLGIKQDGLKIDQEPNFTFAAQTYIKNFYGLIPIFVSLNNPLKANKNSYFQNKNKDVVLSFEFPFEKLFSDFPTLVSHHDLYFGDDDTAWFEKVPKQLKPYDNDEFGFLIQDLIFDPVIRAKVIQLTKTATIMENIPLENIKKIT